MTPFFALSLSLEEGHAEVGLVVFGAIDGGVVAHY